MRASVDALANGIDALEEQRALVANDIEERVDRSDGYCLACGHACPEGRHCPQCGTRRPLDLDCSTCGAILSLPLHLIPAEAATGDLHCPSCGAHHGEGVA